MERAKSDVPKIVVVGGGIIGSACAIALQSRGATVMLIDDASAQRSASWGNAGHIAIEQTEPLASMSTITSAPRRLWSRDGALSLPLRDIAQWLPFSVRLALAARVEPFTRGHAALGTLLSAAMPAWERYVRALGDESLLLPHGHIILWDTPESAARGRAAWQSTRAEGARFRDLTDDEMRAVSALIGKTPAGAIKCEGSASIAGHDLLEAAFRHAFKALGGWIIQGLASVEARGDRVNVSVPGFGRLDGDQIVLAAGVASRPIMEVLGFRAPMIAERGYHVQSTGSAWPQDLPPIVFEDRSMIVTRFRDSVRASSFVEFSRADRPADSRKWAALRRRISELRLPFELPGEEWVGCRPTLPDYLPAIGRSRHHANLVYAFGHQHLGLTLGPLTGEIVADLIEGASPAMRLDPFDIERFGPWSARRQRSHTKPH